jgi:putative membrane protein
VYTYQAFLLYHLVPWLGDRRLDDPTLWELEGFINRKREWSQTEGAPATRKREDRYCGRRYRRGRRLRHLGRRRAHCIVWRHRCGPDVRNGASGALGHHESLGTSDECLSTEARVSALTGWHRREGVAMWGYDHDVSAWMWWLMAAGMLLFWVLVTVLVVALVRSGTTRSRTADDVLAERFARGEITEEEFRRRQELLRQ